MSLAEANTEESWEVDHFGDSRRLFELAQQLYDQEPVIVDLVGPIDRIRMIATRLAHSHVEPTEVPGQASMWIVGVLDSYVDKRQRSTDKVDLFYFYGASATGEPIHVAIEAEYLSAIEPLFEED